MHPEMIDDAARKLTDNELVAMSRYFAADYHAAAESRPRMAAVLHALAAVLDAESCARQRTLEECDADVEGEGAIMDDFAAVLEAARRELREGEDT